MRRIYKNKDLAASTFAGILFAPDGRFTIDFIKKTQTEVSNQMKEEATTKHRDKPHHFIVRSASATDIRLRKIVKAPSEFSHLVGKTVKDAQEYIYKQRHQG